MEEIQELQQKINCLIDCQKINTGIFDDMHSVAEAMEAQIKQLEARFESFQKAVRETAYTVVQAIDKTSTITTKMDTIREALYKFWIDNPIVEDECG